MPTIGDDGVFLQLNSTTISIGDSPMGLIYREVGRPISTHIELPLRKLKWWERVWRVLNMDVKDLFWLIWSKFR